MIEAWKEANRKAPGDKGFETRDHLFIRIQEIMREKIPNYPRAAKACRDKWERSEKIFRCINDFNNKLLKGSSGHGNWWSLTEKEQRDFRQKYNVIVLCITNLVFQLICIRSQSWTNAYLMHTHLIWHFVIRLNQHVIISRLSHDPMQLLICLSSQYI